MEIVLMLALMVAAGFGYYYVNKMMSRGVGALKAKANQNVFFKERYAAEHALVKERLCLEAVGAPADFERELARHVVAEECEPKMAGALYVVSRRPNGVTYLWGNRFTRALTADVDWEPRGDKTLVTFKVTAWQERSGMITGIPALKHLRAQVEKAVAAIGPARPGPVATAEGIDVAPPALPAEESAAADFTAVEGASWKRPLRNFLFLASLLCAARAMSLLLSAIQYSFPERLVQAILFAGGAALCYLAAQRTVDSRESAPQAASDVASVPAATAEPPGVPAAAFEPSASTGPGSKRTTVVVGAVLLVLLLAFAARAGLQQRQEASLQAEYEAIEAEVDAEPSADVQPVSDEGVVGDPDTMDPNQAAVAEDSARIRGVHDLMEEADGESRMDVIFFRPDSDPGTGVLRFEEDAGDFPRQWALTLTDSGEYYVDGQQVTLAELFEAALASDDRHGQVVYTSDGLKEIRALNYDGSPTDGY